MMKKRDTLVESLKKNLVKVVFTKLNGDERIMNCTLHESLLPETTWREEFDKTKKINEEILPVWDIDANGWRSFRLDSITDIHTIKEI